jgi:hypothetical protein
VRRAYAQHWRGALREKAAAFGAGSDAVGDLDGRAGVGDLGDEAVVRPGEDLPGLVCC